MAIMKNKGETFKDSKIFSKIYFFYYFSTF